MTRFARLIRIADRLGEVEAGSAAADLAIHAAIGLPGEPPPYTTDEAAARGLLPDGFEWMESTYLAGTVYMACRRMGLDGEWPYPHHGQWGRTNALARCGAAMRAHAALVKG